MKLLSPSRIGPAGHRGAFFSFILLVLLPAMFLQSVLAQPAQLSLADILIALRSKKVTLAERNKLIGDAVKTRGITFALTPEIEKELQNTGADKILMDSIKFRSPAEKTVEKLAQNIPLKPALTQAAVPISTPVPPDFNFYQKRADGSIAKGDFDSAVADYSKAIELRSMEPSVYLNRGIAHLNKKNYDLSIQDFNKVIELDPKQSTAYLNRGNSFEKKGEIQKALNDYQKAFDLDAGNEAAKTSLQRLQAEQAKLNPPPTQPQSQPQTQLQNQTQTQTQSQAQSEPKPKDPAPPLVTEAAKPQSINIGAAIKSQAIKLVMPVYNSIDRQRNLQGVVTVEVTLDEEGKVTGAKATTGPKPLQASAEDAARRTKFKPVLFEGRGIKASGFINYNFVGQGN